MSATLKISALELHQQHEDAIVHKQSELQKLEAEIADDYTVLEELRHERLRSNPESRGASATSEEGQLDRRLQSKIKECENLVADIQIQRQLLEQLTEQRDAEREKAEVEAAQAQIESTEKAVAQGWTTFCRTAHKLRDQWEPLCAEVQQLDALPAGELPMTPFPGDLARAFELALRTEPGLDAFVSLPRVNPRRLPITRTQGVGARDTTGNAHTLREMGEWT
jgi:hypothetical protein